MATTLIGSVLANIQCSYVKSSDLTTVNEGLAYLLSSSYTNGTGANQANALYTDTRTLAATNESFDLNAGTIFDSYGTGLVFTSIKFFFVKNKSTTSGQRLTITGDWLIGVATSPLSTSTATPTINIGPSGYCLLDSPVDGFLVTTTLSDGLTVTNTATFDYDIILLGTV